MVASSSDRARRRWRALPFLLFGLAAAPSLVAAQGSTRIVEGRVVIPAAPTPKPIAGSWVTLHRVGADRAGPVDSVRSDAAGRYRFQFLPTGDTTAIYFVSSTRGGVAYFTAPLRDPIVRGAPAEIAVYDTTSADFPLTVRGRHVIVTAPDSTETRTIIEVFEISNDSAKTRIAGAAERPTFEAPLPEGAAEVMAGQGEVSADALRAERGRVKVYASLAPGLRQFSFTYRLPLSGDPVAFPSDASTPVLEVLVEDPQGKVEGAGLLAVDDVQVDGRPFKRFLAQDVAASAVFRVTAPGGVPTSARNLRLLFIVAAVGAAMLLGLGMALMRRGPAALARRREDDPNALALAVAALDERFEQIAEPTEAERAQHYLERARLKGRLSAVLAKRDGLG